MSISYSGLTNYGKATLPSVETWGTNNNILRDPPKAIMTRRIDKVGQTNEVNALIEQGPDRSCEYINKFARGRNPFVSVDYSNYGTNSGGGSFSATGLGSSLYSPQARLPYAAIQNGAFRPPIKTQDELLPLSRLRRPGTFAYTNPEVIDYTKRMRTCGDDTNTREVRPKIISVSSQPTKSFKIERPVPLQDATIRYSTTDKKIKIGRESGIRTMNRTVQHAGKPTKEITNCTLKGSATTNISAYTRGKEGYHNLDTDRYIVADPIQYDIVANRTGPDNTDITNLMGSVSRHMKDNVNAQGYTNHSGIGDTTRYEFDNEIELKKNIPQSEYEMQQVAFGSNPMENMGREVRLREKVNPGGFEGKSSIPLTSRQDAQYSQAIQEQEMNRKVMESIQSKFGHDMPF